MKIAIFDTNVLSYLFRRDSTAAEYELLYRNTDTPIISHVTIVELHYGAHRKAWGARKFSELEKTTSQFMIFYPDLALCEYVARLQAKLEGNGHNIGYHDLWIAACALILNCPVVTHNRKHFEPIEGLRVLSVTNS